MSRAIRIVQGRFGRVALLDMDGHLVTHAHRHCHVLFKAGGSDAAFEVRGQLCPLSAKGAVLVNSWEPHAYVHSPGTPSTLILALYIEPEWFADIDRGFRGSGDPGFFSAPWVAVPTEVAVLVERISQALAHGAALEQDELGRLMCEIGARFSRRQLLRPRAGATPRVVDFRVRRSLEWLEDNPAAPIDGGSLAGVAGLSRAQFYARFREETDLTPTLFRNVVRMERAIDLLAAGPEPLGAVSAGLGFPAQSHFTRFFRQHLGITPTEYRRKLALVA